MKSNYPLFIIDRSTTKGYPYHHIAVMADVPFVIRVSRIWDIQSYAPQGAFYMHPLRKGAIIFEVVSCKDDGPRIQSLLKKAAKKYMLALRADNYKGKDLSLDNQIYQQRLTVEHNKGNYTALVKRAGGDTELAKYNIALAEATLRSLELLKCLKEDDYGK